MAEDGALAAEIGMMQLCDSMFPAGTFAMSNGIESMYLAGGIRTAADLEKLNAVYIRHQVGPSDCAMAAAAHDHCRQKRPDMVRLLDAKCLAMKPVRESREAAVRSGTQLARCVAEFLRDDGGMLEGYLADIDGKKASGVYPVSFGVCCHSLGISPERAALMLLYGFVAGNVGAALRLGIIDHFEAQSVIHRLKPLMADAAKSRRPDGYVWQFCPQAEIFQMSHETLDSKMFIT